MARRTAAVFLAWLVPGAGHCVLGRWQRAAVFFVLVIATLAIGCQLEGRLWWAFGGTTLQQLATLGCMGMGLPYFLLQWGLEYRGVLTSGTYEYGSAFILTAGLMNILLILDAWDIAHDLKP